MATKTESSMGCHYGLVDSSCSSTSGCSSLASSMGANNIGSNCGYESTSSAHQIMLRNYVQQASAMCWPSAAAMEASSRYSQHIAAAAAAAVYSNSTTSSPNCVSQQQMGTFAHCHSTTPSTPLKKKPTPVPDSMKDEQYWERRRRNNESARRSREVRRSKEDSVTIRVVFLEQENLQLRTELGLMKQEVDKLRMLFYHQGAMNAAAI